MFIAAELYVNETNAAKLNPTKVISEIKYAGCSSHFVFFRGESLLLIASFSDLSRLFAVSLLPIPDSLKYWAVIKSILLFYNI